MSPQRSDEPENATEDPVREKAWADALIERINRTHYQENLERGLAAREARDWESALQSFKLARTYLVAPEIEKLIEEAKTHIKEAKGSS